MFERSLNSSWIVRPRLGPGFTIVELLVTSVIVGTVLLGVHAIFLQAIDVEGRATDRQDRREALAPIIAHLAERLEHAVNLPEIPAIVGGPDGDHGQYAITCCVGPSGNGGRSIETLGIQRRRYRWNLPSNEGQPAGIEMQILTYAGTRNVTPVAGADGLSEPELWNAAPSRIISRRVSDLSILYRKAGQANAPWLDRWSGPAGEVVIRICASLGGETVEKVVLPRASASLTAPTG